MRYLALACDYDGTIATGGRLDAATARALERCRESGRRVILVTGRELPQLREVCPRLDLFDRVVGENGALLYDPATRTERPLASPPPAAFVERLRALGVAPLSVGRVIVATREPHEEPVIRAVRQLGLEREVIFNKGAVMILPSGINKATGLRAALAELRLSCHNVVAVGDAENDHAFLAACELGVAVSNALPSLREEADLVTRGDHGAGVAELVDHLLADDLRSVDARVTRHDVPVGTAADGSEVGLSPPRLAMLVAGPRGRGESSDVVSGLVAALARRLSTPSAGYQCCIVDPEGRHAGAGDAVTLGDAARAPALEDVRAVLGASDVRVVLNLSALSASDRPGFFGALWRLFQDLRARTGRPHWIVVDCADRLFDGPASSAGASVVPEEMGGVLVIASRPEDLPAPIAASVDVAIGLGPEAAAALRAVGYRGGEAGEEAGEEDGDDGGGGPTRAAAPAAGLIWWRRGSGGAIPFVPATEPEAG